MGAPAPPPRGRLLVVQALPERVAMQPLSCDGGCGGPGQVMITIVETGDAVALCWNCTADWAQMLITQRVQATQGELAGQAGPDDQAAAGEPAAPRRTRTKPGPRAARRSQQWRDQNERPIKHAITEGSGRPDDGMEHGLSAGTDIARHDTDSSSTGE